MNDCPLDCVLKNLGVSTKEAAFVSDCTPAEVSRARQGGTIPRKLGVFLREAGVGIDDLLLEQQRYRNRQAAEIRERVSSRGAAPRDFEGRTVTREAAGGCLK